MTDALTALRSLRAWIEFWSREVTCRQVPSMDTIKIAWREADEAIAACGWLPIETAPKDVKIILAKIGPILSTIPPSVWWVSSGWWSPKWMRWWDGIEPSGFAGPTHWMPIPQPPTNAQSGRGK